MQDGFQATRRNHVRTQILKDFLIYNIKLTNANILHIFYYNITKEVFIEYTKIAF